MSSTSTSAVMSVSVAAVIASMFEREHPLANSKNLEIALWFNSQYKDFQIVVGDQVLRVHKCVLAARSPVFAAMLTSGLTETQSGQLDIQDFDYETVLEAIKFSYSDRLCHEARVTSTSTSNWKVRFGGRAKRLWDVLTFGHKYDIQHLVRACLHQIKRRRNSYDDSENKFLITSAVTLGCDQILDPILRIFGVISGELVLVPDSYTYPALGDALLAQCDSFKDLKLICNENGTEFLVHKYILAIRCPVFAKMIAKMAGNGDTSGQIKIDRNGPIVIEEAVRFFYTLTIRDEALQKNPDLILGLLKFADQFQVNHLVTSCLQKIDQSKNNLGQEVILTYIQSAVHFESKKILRFILGIFGNLGFEPFDFKKASKESYWN